MSYDKLCDCGMNAAVCEVKRESANKGRKFFACTKKQDDPTRCKLFEFCDGGPSLIPPRPKQATATQAPAQDTVLLTSINAKLDTVLARLGTSTRA